MKITFEEAKRMYETAASKSHRTKIPATVQDYEDALRGYLGKTWTIVDGE